MIAASPKQKQIIAILTKGDKELKAAFVVQQTKDNAKSSTNDLTHAQANDIIYQLGGKPLVYDNWALFDKNKKSHRAIHVQCHFLDWTIASKKYGRIIDLYRLSEWLKNKAPVKKRLLSMSKTEISKTISALENMVLQKNKKG